MREDRAGNGCRARRAARAAAALQHRPLSKHAQHRGSGDGGRSEDQCAQSLLSDLGRVECVRHWRMRLSAKRRQESNWARRRAGLLDCGCHQALPEESQTAGAGIEAFGAQSRRSRPQLGPMKHLPLLNASLAQTWHYRCLWHVAPFVAMPNLGRNQSEADMPPASETCRSDENDSIGHAVCVFVRCTPLTLQTCYT